MGKLELLDTPNGRIAQELVESKYPLFVSSRAAGDVDEKTHEVSIAQIFTYDIVCTPGFAEAKLQQISESLMLADSTVQYLTESVNNTTNITNKKYKVLIEGVSVTETEQVAPINEKAMKMKEQPINLDNLSSPLLEDDEFKLPEADVSPTGSSDSEESNDTEEKKEETSENTSEEKKDENNEDTSEKKKDIENLTDEEKKENRALILNITSEDKEGESSEEPEDDADKSEKREEIVSVEASEGDDDSENTEDSEEVEECGEVEAEKAKKIEAETSEDMKKFQDILNNLSKVESVKESIINNYPFARSLSPENFARFAALTPVQKRKCMRFVVENNIYDIKSINELWATPLNEERRLLKNWLRLASPEDIALYTAASIDEQNAIENMARYCILENKQDVDEFWDKCGLRQRAARQKMNEDFVNRYKVVQKTINVVQESTHPLGYNMDYVAMTEQMYNEM